MNYFITIMTVLSLLGIPTIFAMTNWCVRECKKFSQTLNFLMGAIKSQIRNDLLKEYEIYKERKYITDIELQEWINRYNSYSNLVGENGVLDDRYQQLLQLDNKPNKGD